MKQKILSKIKENGLVAVVRGTDDINAVEISEKNERKNYETKNFK